MRVKLATVAVLSAMAGRMACLKPVGVQKKWVIPPVGSHSSFTAKMYISRVPSRKLGMEMPTREPVVRMLSASLSFFRAVMMPQGMPTSTAMMILAVARFRVLGRRTRISSRMGCRVVYEVPRFSVSRFLK